MVSREMVLSAIFDESFGRSINSEVHKKRNLISSNETSLRCFLFTSPHAASKFRNSFTLMKNGFLACLRLRVCSNFFEFRKIITHELAIFRGIRKIATAQALFGRSIKVSINVRGSHS